MKFKWEIGYIDFSRIERYEIKKYYVHIINVQATIVFKNYRDNCEKRCSGSHKQGKTLLKCGEIQDNLILYI